jgi:hypothetical protein
MIPHEKDSKLADGHWLVRCNGSSATLVAELDEELPEVFYELAMATLDRLGIWLALKGLSNILGSLELTKGGLKYVHPTTHDTARQILKFMSLPPDDQDAEIEKLSAEHVYHETGGGIEFNLPALRERTGKLVADWYDRDCVLAGINHHLDKARELSERLKLCT